MSELESLSQCMMENDAAELSRAQRLRRKALLGSICLEAAVLAVLLLWPLVAPGVLPATFNSTPDVPTYGKRLPTPQRTEPPHANRDRFHGANRPLFQPPTIPSRRENASNPDPPNVTDWPSAEEESVGISGGNETGVSGTVSPPSEPARPNAPVKVSEGVMAARLIHRIEPVYPRIARDSHLTGTVRLRALIGTDGTVRQIEVVSGNPVFVPSAVAAIQQWRYEPMRLNGRPVEVETYITVEFVLH